MGCTIASGDWIIAPEAPVKLTRRRRAREKRDNIFPAKKNNDIAAIAMTISTMFITAWLFFIDEGSYNYQWVTSIFNWLLFILYALPILLGQILIYDIAQKI